MRCTSETELQKLLSEQGYVVIGSSGRFDPVTGRRVPAPIGTVFSGLEIRDVQIDHPFCVIAYTDAAEFAKQNGCGPGPGEVAWLFHYRVTTD